MAQCRAGACAVAHRDDREGGDAASIAPAATAVLLVRVWSENGDLRARLMGPAEAGSSGPVVAVAQGMEAITAEFRRWLQQI